MTAVELMTQNKIQFLEYFRSKFPSFHLSNVFYLDIRYAVKYYLFSVHIKATETELEAATNALINEMVSDGIFKQVSGDTWTLVYAEFQTKTPGRPVLH